MLFAWQNMEDHECSGNKRKITLQGGSTLKKLCCEKGLGDAIIIIHHYAYTPLAKRPNTFPPMPYSTDNTVEGHGTNQSTVPCTPTCFI